MTLAFNRNPEERRASFYPWVWRDLVFSAEEMEEVRRVCEKKQTHEGQAGGRLNPKVRVTDVSMHYVQDDNAWIFDRLDQTIRWANDTFYGFDVTGYSHFQFGVYHSHKGAHSATHTDCHYGPTACENGLQRKLSLSILLDGEFTGGEFFVNTGNGEEVAALTPGRAIVFPSFVPHGVRPVTSGTRTSLAAWALGPKFR